MKDLKVINNSNFNFSDEVLNKDELNELYGGMNVCLCNKNAFKIKNSCVCNKNSFGVDVELESHPR